MNKHTKGISLISLIITILIIAILAAVMIPSGIDKINNAKLTSFNENILTIKQEANTYLMQNDEYPVKMDVSGNPMIYSIASNASLVAEATKKNDQNDTFYIIDLDKVKLDNKDNGVGKSIDDFYIISKTSGNVYYAKGQKIGNITYYTKQNKGDGVIATVPSTAPVPNGAFDGSVNSPKLSIGMTPVKWNGSAWVNADSTNANNDWYDYGQGLNKWANVKLVDGSMLVWIPRYTYKIISAEHTSTNGVIDIKYSVGTRDDTTSGYKNHPAFYWGGWTIPASAPMVKQNGGVELTGIWVGKFEPSYAIGGKVQIKAGYPPMTNLSVDQLFAKCQNMQVVDSSTYGITTDTNIADFHMMKNSEWGAVAYLSKYARGANKVLLNTVAFTSGVNDTTGMGVKNNVSQSTTGNEYGIYDMAGCSHEFMAAYINNANATAQGASVVNASPKYKDVLPIGTTDTSIDNYNALSMADGHAIYETSSTTSVWNGTTFNSVLGSSWFGSFIGERYGQWDWVIRGGYYNEGDIGGIFEYATYTGNSGAIMTFRACVSVQ